MGAPWRAHGATRVGPAGSASQGSCQGRPPGLYFRSVRLVGPASLRGNRMARPRFERAAPEKREALLDAAATEFAAHGYETASLNRILLSAGLSKGSFYYYFEDKADLAAAVLARETAR